MEHDLYLISNDFWHKRKMYNFDSYNVLLAIATNTPVLLMTASVLQSHIYTLINTYIIKKYIIEYMCMYTLYIYTVYIIYIYIYIHTVRGGSRGGARGAPAPVEI